MGGDGPHTEDPPEPWSLSLVPLPCSHLRHFLQRNPSQAQLKKQRGYHAVACTRPRINPCDNKSPLWFRQLTRVSAPITPRHSTPQGQRDHPEQHTLHHAGRLQRKKERKCLWSVSPTVWTWTSPDSNISAHQQQGGGLPSLG